MNSKKKMPAGLAAYSLLETTWGKMAAVWTEQGLWELTLPAEDIVSPVNIELEFLPGVPPEKIWLDNLQQSINDYFAGSPVSFATIPLDWQGYTVFQAEVLRWTTAIPYGQTAAYGQVAAAIGRPRSARAVGGTLHRNRTPLLIPCHRVVGAKGSLTGFAGGLLLKKKLLLLEKAELSSVLK